MSDPTITRLPLAALLASFAALAQQPTPTGFSGSFAVCSQGVGNNDQLQFLGAAPNLTVPMTGRAARTLHRRALQAPQETEIAVAYDGVSALPLVLVPTEIVNATGGVTGTRTQVVDFRTGAPVASSIVLAGTNIPYDILVHPTQPRAFVATFGVGGSSSIVLWQLGFAPGVAPAVTARLTTTLGGNPFVTRMALSANGQQLIVAGTTSIATFSLAGAAPVPIGVTAVAGANMMIGTNPVSGLVTGTAVDTLVGTRSVNGPTSHSYLGIASAGGAPLFGAVSPFGAGMTLAPGFHEIGVATVNGSSVCCFLVHNPLTLGVGAVGLLSRVVPTATPVTVTPFGNPELPRVGATDPFVMAGTDAAGNDSALAVGSGAVFAAGVAVQTGPLPGFIEPASMDRPYNLPGTSGFVFTMGVGGFPANPPGTTVVTVGATPPLTLTAAPSTVAPGGASSLPNPQFGGLFPVGVPLLAQGFAGAAGTASDQLVVGLPGVPPIALTSAGTSNVPAGGFVFVPSTASAVPTFGPRRPAFNAFQFLGGLRVDVAYPGPALPAPPTPGPARSTLSLWQLSPALVPTQQLVGWFTSELRAL